MTEWTRELVVHRLREAWDTLRRLPEPVFPAPLTSAWPELVRDWREACVQAPERPRLARPSPASIDRMHETIGWFCFIAQQPGRRNATLEDHERLLRAQSRAVWLCCACGLGLTRAAGIMGSNRHLVRGFRDAGLDVILRALRKRPPRWRAVSRPPAW